MRTRSPIDTVIENTLQELEYELESEAEAPGRPPLRKFHKWVVYTSTSLSGGPWRFNRVEVPPKMMYDSDAKSFGEALLRRLAPIVGPLDSRVAFQRCVLDENGTWKPELGSCRQIEVLTNRISACDGAPPRTC